MLPDNGLKKIRTIIPKLIVLSVIMGVIIMSYAYVNLEFCYKIMSHNSLDYMVSKMKDKAASVFITIRNLF